MSEQIKKYIDPIKNFWINLSKKKKIILISVLAGIVLISVIVGIMINAQPLVVLYPGLDHGEAVEVMNELKDRGVTFKEDNGTIYVPKDQENSLRMDLANEGHPKTAPNYDFFTKNTSVMSTDYEKKLIEQYQLNQRLEAVIKTLDGVDNSNVTISIPDQSDYAWDDKAVAPTASVTVTMAQGKSLQAKQVNGIKQLVAKSVPNLKADDVAVIDTATGQELSDKQDNSNTQVDISQFKRMIEKEYEQDVENNILKVLTPVYGTGNVKVTAKSIMDVDKKIQEIITYQPSKDNKGVISEETTDKEQGLNSGSSTGGVAGTQTNANNTATYPGVTVNGNVIYTKDAQSYKYLVSQVKQQIQGDAANIKDMTISVVINKAMMDNNQKSQIASIAANAAAISPSKVAVFSAAFAGSTAVNTNAQAGLSPALTQMLIYGGAALGALILIIIIAAVIISNRRKKKREELLGAEAGPTVPEDFYQLGDNVGSDFEQMDEEQPEGDIDGDLEDLEEQPESEGEDLVNSEISKANEERMRALKALEQARDAQASKEEALKRRIQDFSAQNPEIAAQLIRIWLRGEDLDG
ncbi:MAG TPA: flagellar basal-body MS-ring/collar protein FliF [Caproiciproducens sp.]|nr:flagellar basal-body MS-ring/collar protein FliF [Caproiciproducens sp.]